MPGRLMTDVIDGARGVPASGMLIDLFRLPRRVGERHHLKTVATNEAGATDAPLVDAQRGYRLTLLAGPLSYTVQASSTQSSSTS